MNEHTLCDLSSKDTTSACYGYKIQKFVCRDIMLNINDVIEYYYNYILFIIIIYIFISVLVRQYAILTIPFPMPLRL